MKREHIESACADARARGVQLLYIACSDGSGCIGVTDVTFADDDTVVIRHQDGVAYVMADTITTVRA